MDDTVDLRPPAGSVHRAWLSVPTGLLAVAAGVLIILGGDRPIIDQRPLRQFASWPDPYLYLGLAIAVAAFGLLALLGRSALARIGLGALLPPALLLVTLTSGLLLDLRRLQPDLPSLLEHRLGGQLILLGLGLALLAALLAGGQVSASTVRGRGGWAAVLATLGGAGLLHSLLSASITGPANAPTEYSYLTLFSTPGDIWGPLVLAVGLAWLLTALGLATSRRGAAASGLALGAAVAIGVDLAVRLSRDAHAMTVLAGPNQLSRRVLPLAVLAGTVLAYLLVAVLVRGQRASRPDGQAAADLPPPGRPPPVSTGADWPLRPADEPASFRPLIEERGTSRPRPSTNPTTNWPPGPSSE